MEEVYAILDNMVRVGFLCYDKHLLVFLKGHYKHGVLRVMGFEDGCRVKNIKLPLPTRGIWL